MRSIFVVGDAMLDRYLCYRSTGRLSPESGQPIVERVACQEQPGGAAAVADMVRGLGEPAFQYFGRPFSLKERHRIDGREVFRHDLDRAPDERPLRPQAHAGDILLVADYGKGSITADYFRQLVETGARVIVDPARGTPWDNYRGAWGICPNRLEWEAECQQLGQGRGSYFPATQGFVAACYKLDSEGLIAEWPNGVARIPSVARQPIVDCCGAGDMVLAALGVGLVRGMNWLEACRFANLAAGVKCGKLGAVPVSMEEIHEFRESVNSAGCQPVG